MVKSISCCHDVRDDEGRTEDAHSIHRMFDNEEKFKFYKLNTFFQCEKSTYI